MNYYTQTYQAQEIQTASQEQILIMLYDGAIRFLNIAKMAHEERNIEKFHNNLIKTQRILMEFMTTLDLEAGGEVAQNLLKLYEYLHHQLIQANVKKDVTMVEEVLTHLRELKETWEKAIGLSRQEQQSAGQRDDPSERVYCA